MQMRLSLSKVEKNEPSYDEESNIFQPIKLIIKLPTGSIKEFNCTTGDTVQIIKKRLEAEDSIPYKETVCYCAGEPMLEPLSLNDFPNLDLSNPVIEVKYKE
jgi:hypothetical protein